MAVLYDVVGTAEKIMETPISMGNWQFKGVANGSYYLLILNGSGLIDELYSEVPCPGGSCDISGIGTPIDLNSAPVTLQKDKSNGGLIQNSINATISLDMVLDVGVDFYGVVQKDSMVPKPVNGATVFILDTSGEVTGTGITNALGEYKTEASLPDGDYLITAMTNNQKGANMGLVNEVFDDIPCPIDCDLAAGTQVSIISNDSDKEINFILDGGASITGQVSVVGSMISLIGSTVILYNDEGFLVGESKIGFNDWYQIQGLPAGTYYALIKGVFD
jgi:hypothetical protein